MKDKFMSVNGKQVVVISSNDNKATVMSFPKNDNMVQAFMETVTIDQLEPYKCPYADETDPTRIYCNAGICEYPVNSGSASQAMFACDQCLIKSLEAEDEANT
jgi:hypothetical protein